VLSDESGAVLVGNFDGDTVAKLKTAAPTRPVVDLTRLNPDMVSGGSYAWICW
jgi:GDP-mannose 6-dehydrogenase